MHSTFIFIFVTFQVNFVLNNELLFLESTKVLVSPCQFIFHILEGWNSLCKAVLKTVVPEVSVRWQGYGTVIGYSIS